MDAEKQTIRALTICEPWAWAIFHGKRFENREWHTDYVGPLVIHAGKSRKWMKDGLAFLRGLGLEPSPADLVFGAVLGVVDMTGCVRRAEAKGPDGKIDPFAFGPYCHVYDRPRLLSTPVLYSGRQGFFSVPRSLVAELLDEPSSQPEPSHAQSVAERINRAIRAAGPGNLRPAGG